MPGKKKLFRCGICQKEAVWDKYKQDRHVKTHTGAAHPLPEGTRDVGRSERYRDNERSMKQLLGSVEDRAEFAEIVKRVQDLKHSGPPGFRYTGGRFEAGPLQDKGYHEGMPEFFSEQGRLRQRFEWIMTYPVDRRVSTRLAGKGGLYSARPRATLDDRRQSYSNRRWTDRSEKESEFTYLSTNLWTPGKYASWVCPDGSDGNREDPTLVGKLERQCDLCDGTQLCDCIQSRVSQHLIPSVVSAGDMGEGTIAGRPYNVGDLLREFVGELVPLGSCEDGWAADLYRDDELAKPVVWCSVHPRYYGNWARKMNHSCEFNVVLESMRVSQRWRVMIRAVKPIEVGSWVTADYGEGYWKDSGMICLCGSESCRDKRESLHMGALSGEPQDG